MDSLLATGQKILALVIKRIKEQHVQQHGLGPGGEPKINDDDCKQLIFAPVNELPLDANARQATSNGVPNSWCEAAEWASPDVWAELDAFSATFNHAPQLANPTAEPRDQRRSWWVQPMALCRFAVALSLSYPNVGKRSACCEAIVSALAQFNGVGRRFQRHGEVPTRTGAGHFTLIDDYGHHPVEIAATVAAARGAFAGRRLVLAFQPHRFTRTRDCFEDFVQVLRRVDVLCLSEVYAAGEAPIAGADGRALARALRMAGVSAASSTSASVATRTTSTSCRPRRWPLC
jgi:hypothetical protein